MNLRMAAEKTEARWDGITAIVSTIGITAVSVAGVMQGTVGTEGIILSLVALSGVGGYSLHNVVRNGGNNK
jgi:hypothetical protein